MITELARSQRLDYLAERSAAAARRADGARRRCKQLEQRLERLRAKHAPSPDDLDDAEDHLWRSLEEVERARDRLSVAYAYAAEAHERAARLFNAWGRADESEKHRMAAVLDRIEADIV